MKRDEAVVTILIKKASFAVTIVGPVSGKAKDYATTIDAWRKSKGFDGDVIFSQEDDSSAAQFTHTVSKFGVRHLEQSINVNELREALAKVEPRVFVALSIQSGVVAKVSDPHDHIRPNGIRYWNLTKEKLSNDQVHTEVVVTDLHIAGIATWVLLLPISSLCAFIFIKRSFVKPGVSIAVQRRKFGRTLNGFVYGGIGLHAALTAATLPTRFFDPVTEAWFDVSFARLGILLTLAMLLLALSSIKASMKYEKIIFGPTEEERAMQTALGVDTARELEDAPPMVDKKTKRIANLLRGVGVMLFLGGVFLFDKHNVVRPFVTASAIVLGLIAPFAIEIRALRILVKKNESDVDNSELPRLESILNEINVATQQQLIPKILPDSNVDGAAIARSPNIVGVSELAITILDDDELRFIVAHEAAHHKLGHLKKRSLTRVLIVCFIISVVAISTSRFLPFPVTHVLMLGVVVLLFGGSGFTMRRDEMACDEFALRVTQNLEAAERALRKVALSTSQPGIHTVDQMTHPAVQKRIARLREIVF